MVGRVVGVNGGGAGSPTRSSDRPRDRSLSVRVERDEDAGNVATMAAVVLMFPAAEESKSCRMLHVVLLLLHTSFPPRGGSALGYTPMSLVDGRAVAAGIPPLVSLTGSVDFTD